MDPGNTFVLLFGPPHVWTTADATNKATKMLVGVWLMYVLCHVKHTPPPRFVLHVLRTVVQNVGWHLSGLFEGFSGNGKSGAQIECGYAKLGKKNSPRRGLW